MNTIMFKLFASCVKVKGACRSAIYDLQNSQYYLIPNTLFSLFNEEDVLEINPNDFTEEQLQVINEYVSFLIDKNLIFKIEEAELPLFPKLDTEWDYPSIISNAIIDIKENSTLDWEILLQQLIEVKCYNIQIRFFTNVDSKKIQEICDVFKNSILYSIEFLLPYNANDPIQNWETLVENNLRVRSIILYGADRTETINNKNKGFSGIYLLQEVIHSESHCGIILPDYFSTNISSYTESLQFNSCLNRKISVDADGNIKNCPSMKQAFGNIQDTTLLEATEKQGFKKLWNITKDQIHVCKDCEFRHICTDCRAYVEDPEDIHSKPLKCGYNPYTGEWQAWADIPTKQVAIQHYELAVLTNS